MIKINLLKYGTFLRIGIIAVLFLFVACLQGFSGNLKFEYLTPNDGLSQATVSAIIEDNDGFVWFGTRNGLNRYDGYTFHKYYNTPGDTNSLAGDLIVCLYKDKKNNIWIGTNEGFCIYNKKRDAFINFKHKNNYPEVLKNNSVGAIYEDSKGNIWIGFYSVGLAKYAPGNGNYELFQHQRDDNTSIAAYSVHSITEDKLGNMWIGTDGGLSLYNPSKKNFKNFRKNTNNSASIPNNLIWSMTNDTHGDVWIGTLGGGLVKLIVNADSSYAFETFRPNSGNLRRLKILSVFPDNNNGLWLGLENGGLDYFNTNTKNFEHYSTDENSLFSLNSNSVQTAYVDKIGNLWVGTYTGGINVNKIYRKNITTIRKIPGNSNSLSNNAVTTFFVDKEKNIWVCTDGGGIDVISNKNGKFRNYNMRNSGLLSDAVLSICEDAFGNIWAGGWECGLNVFDKKTGNFVNLSTVEYQIPNNNIFDIHPDKKGNLWIAFGGAGFGKFNFKKNTFKQYEYLDRGKKINWIFDLHEDKNGNILLGHSNGFSVFNPDTEAFFNYSNSETDSLSLSHNLINNIYTASDSTIWIGTSSGLNRFYPNSKTFKRYFINDGLPNNNIVGILEDFNKNIWISTNDGISCFDIKSKSFRNIRFSDGLQGKGFVRSSCYQSTDGYLFFGGTAGFNIFHPDSLIENPNLPKVVINSFSIFNKPVEIGAPNSPLSTHINECEKLVLSYKHSVISFEFAAIEFTSPAQNQFAYFLEGFEKDWVYAGTSRIATYTNLDPGKYVLHVKASNNDGKWANAEKMLTIIIKPPFWKTFWFRLLLALVVLSSLAIYINRRVKRLKLLNQKLENKVKERTSELEARTNQLQETTVLLEEKQEEVNIQNEEILAQRDNLANVNRILTKQKEHIEHQNAELNQHRFKLELLVDERTRDLEMALYKAEESDRLKSSFLSNMSHEIRTPLNAIMGFATLLSEPDITNNERSQFVNIITKNSESLLVLINDILDLSKIQANKLQLIPANIQLNVFLNEIFESFKLEAGRRKIDLLLVKSCVPDDFYLNADPVRLKQVIGNLIYNSIKFTEKGSVEFGVKEIGKNVTFFVKDTGIGIPKDTGDAIFKRFLKLEYSKNVLYGGTGLGLAICKSLIDLWGGEISYKSAENVGTTFWFTYPVDNAPVTKQKNSNTGKDILFSCLSDKVILIAEDVENNYRLLSVYLRNSGAKIFWVQNGQEAVEFVKENNVDIILMDIKMPVMNGLEATKIIKSYNPKLIIIAQTAFAYEYELRDLSKIGFDDIVVKPLKNAELYEVLQRCFCKD